MGRRKERKEQDKRGREEGGKGRSPLAAILPKLAPSHAACTAKWRSCAAVKRRPERHERLRRCGEQAG